MKQVQQFLEQIDGLRVHLRPVDEGHLKYLSVVLMVIDHIACMFLERVYLPDGRPLMYSLSYGTTIDGILRAIGRQPFPIFCYFLVEGFMKTSSRGRYLLRLLIFAVLSQYPFQKSIFPRSADFHGSVFCTLLIGMLSIWVIEAMGKIFLGNGRENEGPGAAGAAARENTGLFGPAGSTLNMCIFAFVSFSSVYGFARLAKLLHTDYSYGGVILIVLLYVFRDYRIPGLFISWAWLTWYNRLELYSAPAFFLLAGYNGKRGKQHKYFFYFFYPAHLMILLLIRIHFFGA